MRARRLEGARLVLDLAHAGEREGAAALVAELLADRERRPMARERRLGGAREEMDAPDVVERGGDTGRVARDLEQRARELEVDDGQLGSAQRAVEAADAAVCRPALRGQIEAPREAQHLAEVSERLARAAEARRDVTEGIKSVHLRDGVVDVEQANGRRVEHVRAIEQQARPRVAGRRDEAIGGAPRVAGAFVKVGQRLEALLACRAAAALEPLRREEAAPAQELRLDARTAFDACLLERAPEAPRRLAGERGLGQPLEVVARLEPLEDLLDLRDGGVGREDGRLVGGRAPEPTEGDDAARPEDAAEDGAPREHVALGGRERRHAHLGHLLARERHARARGPLGVERPAG